MVDPFCFVLHSWLAGIAGRNKLLINMKAHLQRCAFCFAFIWFRVQGSGLSWRLRRLFLLGRCPEVAFKSPVISLISGEWIVSPVWHEILRLSPHLFWRGLFTHRAFSSAQDDDTGERMGSHLGDMLRVLELAVLYYDTSSPLEKGRAKGAGWIHEAV